MYGGKRLGYEFKWTGSPKVTRSMRSALETLKLDELTVVVPGVGVSFALEERVNVKSLDVVIS